MTSLFPREEHAEALFHRILSNPGAEQQLYETFCMEQENASFEDGGGAECSFAKALLQAYENRDISALTIALCNNTMFDLLRTAYLIPYRFHGKNGGNPRLLTDANGEVREEYRNAVSARELRKFHDIYRQHLSVPRAALYLADGSHLRHKYTKDMQVREMYSPSRRGVLTLYALPDTVEQGLTEAQAYNIVWDAFNEIQQRCPTAMVFYGQDTGYKLQKSHDELGVLLPLKEFEHNILHHLEPVDGIVLRCREEMIHQQARIRCRCKTNNKTAAMRKTHSSGFGLSAENQVQ